MAARSPVVRKGGQNVQHPPGDALLLRGPLDQAPVVVLNAASTVLLGPQASDFVQINGVSGAVTILSFGDYTPGAERTVVFGNTFNGVTLNQGGRLDLPNNGANILVGTGDRAVFRSFGNDQWKCIAYTRNDGTALVAPATPLNTDQLNEGNTNLYFTQSRARNTALTGLQPGSNTSLASTDTVLVAFANLQAQIAALGKAFRVESVQAGSIGQTAFTVPNGYVPGNIVVWLNGVLLQDAEYTATNSPTVALTVGATSAQDVLQVGVLSAIRAQDDALLLSTVAALPSASTSLAKIRYCTNMAGRAGPVYSDGTNWRRFVDDSVVTT